MAADSQVVLGLRHTGGGNAFLAGEIAEARLYDKALSADEVAASYKAGPLGIALEQALKYLPPDRLRERERYERGLNGRDDG